MTVGATIIPGKGTFARGVHPPERKGLAADAAIEVFPTPAQVKIPLLQHTGRPAELSVKPRYTVDVGQKIGEATGLISAGVHASIAGKVGPLTTTVLASGLRVPAVTITADSTTGNDTSNSFTVAPGDLLNLFVEPLNTPLAIDASWSVTFVADANGESLILSGSDDDLDTDITEQYNLAWVTDNNWGAGASSFSNSLDTCLLRDLYVELENAPGAGNSFVFRTSRSTGTPPLDATYGNGNLTVTISGTNTTASDTSNKDEVVPHESVVFEYNPVSNPTIGQVKWGMVMFVKPLPVARGNMLIRAMVAGGFA